MTCCHVLRHFHQAHKHICCVPHHTPFCKPVQLVTQCCWPLRRGTCSAQTDRYPASPDAPSSIMLDHSMPDTYCPKAMTSAAPQASNHVPAMLPFTDTSICVPIIWLDAHMSRYVPNNLWSSSNELKPLSSTSSGKTRPTAASASP